MRLKLAGFLVVLAAIPAGAQSGFEHGHKIGSSIAYLAESAEDAGMTPAQRAEADVLAALRLQFAETNPNDNGSGGRVLTTPNAYGPPLSNPTLRKDPCAVFETWAEQASSDFAESAATGFTGMERTEGKAVLHRFVRDDLRQIYASYTVTVETLPDGTYRVSFGPPTGGPPAQMRGNAVDWKVLWPAKYPVPQIMKDEDSIRVDLYSNGPPGNATRRVIDYIHVGRQDRMVMRQETPHDYYADDAEFAVTKPRVRVNGAASAAVRGLPETLRGPVLWVYVPGHGRYVLALHEHPELGFESAGEVAGNSLTFTAPDGNVFRIDTAERIAAGSGIYTVHVLPDLGWMPADPQDRARVMIGTAPGV